MSLERELKVNKLLAESLGVDIERVKPETTLDDLGADSLDQVEAVMTIEEEFGIDISDEDAEKIKTVQDIYDYLAGLKTQ